MRLRTDVEVRPMWATKGFGRRQSRLGALGDGFPLVFGYARQDVDGQLVGVGRKPSPTTPQREIRTLGYLLK